MFKENTEQEVREIFLDVDNYLGIVKVRGVIH